MIIAVCPNPAIDAYIWVDSLGPGVHRAKKEQRFPGGKGVHVALALKELGEEVILLGFWGGPTGKWIKEKCESYGVRCIGPTIDEWTRTCFTFKSSSDLDETELLGCGPNISALELHKFLEALAEHLPNAKALAMSGSLPLGVTDLYAEMIRMAKLLNIPTFLDCTGEPLRVALKEKPFCLHLNLTESEQFTGTKNILQIFERLDGAEIFAVTAGKDGLYLGNRNGIEHGRVTIEKVYSAVGSGDCLTAGLTAAKVRGSSLTEILKLGVACGAANCLREDLGMLYLKDVNNLLGQIQINHLS